MSSRGSWGRGGIWLLALVGCTESTTTMPGRDPRDLFASGTRLRARIRDAGPGSRTLVGWFDSALGLNCSFEPAEPGGRRCVPVGDVAQGEFADAACTQPALLVGGAVPSGFVRLNHFADPAACSRDWFVTAHPLVSQETRGHIFLRTEGGACVESVVEPPRTFAIYGEARADGEYVSAEERVEPRGDRLGARVWVAADGAREEFGHQDLRRGRACGFPYGGWSDPLCIPMEVAFAVYDYTDDCTTLVGESYAVPECARPEVIFRPVAAHPGAACSGTVEYLEVGEPVDVAAVGHEVGGQCSPLTSDRETYHRLGAPVAEGVYPKVQPGKFGDGRLKTVDLATPEGLRLPTFYGSGYFDAEHDSYCSPLAPSVLEPSDCPDGQSAPADDGATYRVTSKALFRSEPTRFFLPGCRTPLLVIERDVGDPAACGVAGPEPQLVVAYVKPEGAACVRRPLEARTLTAYSGLIFERLGGQCLQVQLDPVVAPRERRLYEIGGIVDPAEVWARIETLTE